MSAACLLRRWACETGINTVFKLTGEEEASEGRTGSQNHSSLGPADLQLPSVQWGHIKISPSDDVRVK